MSDNNIRELFKMLDQDSFEAQFNALDDREVERAKNSQIKEQLGVQIEIMTARRREVMRAHLPSEERQKLVIEEAQSLNPDSEVGKWA